MSVPASTWVRFRHLVRFVAPAVSYARCENAASGVDGYVRCGRGRVMIQAMLQPENERREGVERLFRPHAVEHVSQGE